VAILSAALIAAGLPVAHATPYATVSQPPASAQHHHGMAAAMDMTSHSHESDQAAMPSQRQARHDKVAFDICKCLNCGMCATPVVQPSVRDTIPERVGHRFSHAFAEQICPAVGVGVDPGIPILAA
jgi:hypothetical protein